MLDGRTADLPGWEECGFELLGHASRVSCWDDDDEIAAVHHLEIEDLARDLTGCDHAMVSSHIKRNPERASRHPDLGPIRFVHSDFASGHLDLVRVSSAPRSTTVRRSSRRATPPWLTLSSNPAA